MHPLDHSARAPRHHRPTLWKLVALVALAGPLALATLPDGGQLEAAGEAAYKAVDFNRDVRPILSDHCYACHGPDAENNKSDVRFDIRESAVESGAIVPGNAATSLLVERIYTTDVDDIMPPPDVHKPLTDEQKKTLAAWIDAGAQYDIHWSYKRVEKPAHDSIDAIVREGLRARQLDLSEPAPPRILVRRIYLDTLGLPPTPKQVEAYLQDNSPQAYEALVDQLLSSPHFGENMAIDWLDAVRFTDSLGYHGDQPRDASPFRDYVIHAFNTNKPYDEFVVEQIAGDLLPEATLEQRVAASFNRLNQISQEGGIQDKEYVKKYQAERVRTTSTALLGSTLACAECHDHKFDPFTAKDFYSFGAFFADILEKGAWNHQGSYQEEDISGYLEDPDIYEKPRLGPTLRVPNRTFLEDPAPYEKELARRLEALHQGTEAALAEFENWLQSPEAKEQKVPVGELNDPAKNLLTKHFESGLSEGERNRLRRIYLAEHAKAPSQVERRSSYRAMNTYLNGQRETPATISAKPREMKVLPRGNWMDESGEVVLPETPTFLEHAIASTPEERLDRLDLARWMVHRDNPLTARTYVNRAWGFFFGTPLSSAPEDLGLQGEYPVYPELLDFLAYEFMESGWDIKHLVKTILMSETYRQSSYSKPELVEIDPYNRLLARQSPRRLRAENIRDNALAVSDLLVTRIGGASAKPYQPEGYYQHLNFPRRKYESDQNENQYRRGLYTHWQRTFLHPMLIAFDAPGRDECTVARPQSNTPLQALNQLNDPSFIEAAIALAHSLLEDYPGDDAARLEYAYGKVLARPPNPEEKDLLYDFLTRERERFKAAPKAAEELLGSFRFEVAPFMTKPELAAWTSLTRALLNLHETITRY